MLIIANCVVWLFIWSESSHSLMASTLWERYKHLSRIRNSIYTNWHFVLTCEEAEFTRSCDVNQSKLSFNLCICGQIWGIWTSHCPMRNYWQLGHGLGVTTSKWGDCLFENNNGCSPRSSCRCCDSIRNVEYISLKDEQKTAIGLQWNMKKLDVELQLTGCTPLTSHWSNQLLFPH